LTRSTAGRESAQKSEAESESELPQSDAKSGESQVASSESPRRRGRHVPAAVRRAVFERDKGRCTADISGRRCTQTHREILPRRCHAHNALAAEEDFGRPLIQLKARDASEHEPWAAQPDA
jgi:hypothetical protein